MKGLLIKDLLLLRRMGKRFWLLILLYYFIGMAAGSPTHITVSLMILCVVSLKSTFSYDSASGWEQFALASPVSRGTLVGGKYLFCFIVTGCSAVLGLIAAAAGQILPHRAQEGSAMLALAATLGSELLMCSVLIPLQLRFGNERGGLIMAVFFMLFFAVLYAVPPILREMSEQLRTLARPAAFAAPLLLAAALYVSYLVSCAIVKKKDY